MSEENMMTKTPAGKNDLQSIISSDAMKSQWALVLPKCLTPDRMARVALSQLRKTPKLGQCTQESLLSSLMTCAELGIEPNGRDAHLIPYGKECTLIVDFKGLVRLVRRDPAVKDVQVFTVRENDSFKWTPNGIEHSFGLTADRGEVVGVYTKLSWMNGTESFGEPMTKGEAEAIQKGSKAGRSGPWVSHFTEMWKKSVVRRDSKMWPLSPETQDSINADSDRPILMSAADVQVSGPKYEAPALPVDDEPEKAEEAPAEKPAEEKKPVEEEKTVAVGLTPVADLSKPALIAEVKIHESEPYFAEVMKNHTLADDPDYTKYPATPLRDLVTDLRSTVENGG